MGRFRSKISGRRKKEWIVEIVNGITMTCRIVLPQKESVFMMQKLNEKVLGFNKEDATDECGHGCHWRIDKFVPVVSLKEHNAITEEMMASLKEKAEYISFLEMKLKKKQAGEGKHG